jgi:hypothetical protein
MVIRVGDLERDSRREQMRNTRGDPQNNHRGEGSFRAQEKNRK